MTNTFLSLNTPRSANQAATAMVHLRESAEESIKFNSVNQSLGAGVSYFQNMKERYMVNVSERDISRLVLEVMRDLGRRSRRLAARPLPAISCIAGAA
ncbi:hypothetical protein [Sphingomonas turrisvirgatae]|uniref:hypothetical protein n=1 Tax=Sphingomonas turrisvirgatae TaxID=1888892 RepID=UPI00156B2038|nr:hypothetical protein [Sphingomonas turrisvirgatae]